jgi:hypothetical protein
MRRQSAENRINTLNSRYQVRISLYSVEDGEVGKPVSIPYLVSKHRARTAAGRALAREIPMFKAPRPGMRKDSTFPNTRRGGVGVRVRAPPTMSRGRGAER